MAMITTATSDAGAVVLVLRQVPWAWAANQGVVALRGCEQARGVED